MYVALGIRPDGRREVLGFWPLEAEGEGARNWEEALKGLRRRGVSRVRTFITDDLPGLEEPLRRVFPEAHWQLCVLQAVRDALDRSRKADREALAQNLKQVYRAETKRRPGRRCRSSGSAGAGDMPGLWPAGRPEPMPSWRSSVIPRPSGNTFTPRTSWSGWPRG